MQTKHKNTKIKSIQKQKTKPIHNKHTNNKYKLTKT